MINKGLLTSNSSEWETPQDLFDKLNRYFKFKTDVCATKKNAKCKRYFTKKDDGFKQRWRKRDNSWCWMNPPYGREIGKWVEMAADTGEVVALLPARTDTKYFHEYIYKKKSVEIRFIKGRLKFSKSKNSAPFPSMIVIFK